MSRVARISPPAEARPIIAFMPSPGCTLDAVAAGVLVKLLNGTIVICVGCTLTQVSFFKLAQQLSFVALQYAQS